MKLKHIKISLWTFPTPISYIKDFYLYDFFGFKKINGNFQITKNKNLKIDTTYYHPWWIFEFAFYKEALAR
jgi:hypothetical protein